MDLLCECSKSCGCFGNEAGAYGIRFPLGLGFGFGVFFDCPPLLDVSDFDFLSILGSFLADFV